MTFSSGMLWKRARKGAVPHHRMIVSPLPWPCLRLKPLLDLVRINGVQLFKLLKNLNGTGGREA